MGFGVVGFGVWFFQLPGFRVVVFGIRLRV